MDGQRQRPDHDHEAAGPNAVLSGLFFDPAPTPTPTTDGRVRPADATTQGNWIGAYGAQGYDVIVSAISLPGYATVTPSGQSNNLGPRARPTRALQDPGGTSRIAACWYAATSFTVDVDLTDGQAHDLELYFFDYDQQQPE